MNKTALIIGSLAVLGVGAYFYFRPKKSSTTPTTGTTGASSLTDTGSSSSISVPPTGTTLATPEQVADTAKKIADAKALVVKIVDLRKKRDAVSATSTTSTSTGLFGLHQNLTNTQIANYNKQIQDLNKLLSDLGYAEVNGNLVKII